MDCIEFKELVPALALDALDESERADCAAHLAEGGPHDGCHQAEADARALVARLADVLPKRPVDARVWRGIEDRARAQMAARHATAGARPAPPRWRELGGWGVAVAVLSLYLVKRPLTETPRASAALTPATVAATTVAGAGATGRAPATAACEHAAALLMNREMRRYLFRPAAAQSAVARGALIFDPGERSAVVLVERVTAAPPGQNLRLWAVRGAGAPPALLGGIGDVTTTTEIGHALFEPTLPGKVWLSSDAAGAATPGTVLLTADLAN